MKIGRRDMLITSALSLLSTTRSAAQGAPAQQPQAQRAPQTRLLEALQRNRLPITMGDSPSGPGWDFLVREARGSRFTLIGEEHGVAETARFSSALFKALRPAGYSRVAIELSPPIAFDIETAARRNGVDGILKFFSNPDTWSPMYLRDEARFIADVIDAAPKGERVLWGLDREIFSDRYLIARLEGKVPQRARGAFTRLKEESKKAQAKNAQTKNPDDLFILSQEPALVSALRSAWPDADRESDSIMRTLEESLAVETAERTGGMWPYQQRRSLWMRNNFAMRLKADQKNGLPPKVMLKFGYNHMIRGANYINVFEIGSMADEVAAMTADRAFHILVLPGPGSHQAVLGPGRSFVAIASDEFDDFQAGDQRISRVLPNANATGHEVIDLRALRSIARRGLESWNPDVVRTIHGFDAAVIWKGAHASTG
ncbi:MAG TPA: hypothetical protein VM099_14490 [Gemmatimonadaceae bacterium]|nr:hypothetical protein [Gemmatimonadaceae bacterium]